jgi:hypothetical protein
MLTEQNFQQDSSSAPGSKANETLRSSGSKKFLLF